MRSRSSATRRSADAASRVGPRDGRRALRLGLAALGVAGLAAGEVARSADTAPPAGSGEIWRLLPAAPIDLAGVSTGIWTGREVMFTVPGIGVRRAAAYDPATGRWRRLPGGPAPSTGLEGRDRSVWTGREWILIGWGPNIAYRPATNSWRRLPAAPGVAASPVVVWTGSQVIVWGGGCCSDFSADGAVYRPSTNTWRRLPPSTLSARQAATGTWTGREVVIVGGFTERTFPDGVTRSITFGDAAAYNPNTGSWRRLPPMPAPRRDAVVLWEGRDVLVLGGRRPTSAGGGLATGVLAYRPATDRWRLLRPMPRGRIGHAAVWTGSRAIIWGGTVERGGVSAEPTSTLSFDPVRNAWAALPPSPVAGRSDPAAVWTGREMIVTGGVASGEDATAAALRVIHRNP